MKTDLASIPDLGNFALDRAIHSLVQDRDTPDSARPDARPPGEHLWRPPFGGGHGRVNFGNNPPTSTSDPSGGGGTNASELTTSASTTADNWNAPILNDAWSSWPSSSYDGATSSSGGKGGAGGQSYSSASAFSPASSQVTAGSQFQSDDPNAFWAFDPGRDHFEALRTMLHDQPAMLDPVDPVPEPSSVFLLAALFGVGLLVARRSKLNGSQTFTG